MDAVWVILVIGACIAALVTTGGLIHRLTGSSSTHGVSTDAWSAGGFGGGHGGGGHGGCGGGHGGCGGSCGGS